MTNTPHRVFERHCDVAVVGGSAAGLAAALQLSRQRRSVIVIDDGAPRNARASRMHSYLGHEGCSPAEFAATGREEVRRYGAQVLSGRALHAERIAAGEAGADRFSIGVTGGHAVVARRLVIASGVTDILPPVDGLAPLWGDRVIHCPFCHGYEFRDRRIVQLVDAALGWHASVLYRQLTDRLTIVVADDVEVDDGQRQLWEGGGVEIVRGWPTAVVSEPGRGPVELVFGDGRRLDADVVAVTTRVEPRLGPFASLGVRAAAHPSGVGEFIVTDGSGATEVEGVFAAGNVSDPSQQVAQAAANGAWVGAMVSVDLAGEDLARGVRRSAVEADWDDRYSGERVWSGNPNGALVVEASDLAPGRVLDVGAGEGGDAIWLAERGWDVTASDISANALARIAAAAEERGLVVECLRVDANDPDPYPVAAFDLVTAHYASILRTPDDRAIANLVAAVAPGGTLLVVNHDPVAMRAPIDVATNTRGFDADAYVRIDHVVEHLTGLAGWEIMVDESRPRPAGSASASHHVDDVVLRARRAR